MPTCTGLRKVRKWGLPKGRILFSKSSCHRGDHRRSPVFNEGHLISITKRFFAPPGTTFSEEFSTLGLHPSTTKNENVIPDLIRNPVLSLANEMLKRVQHDCESKQADK